jgi:aquaporin Z
MPAVRAGWRQDPPSRCDPAFAAPAMSMPAARRVARTGSDQSHTVVNRRNSPWPADLLDGEPTWARDFANLSYEWRRLFSEMLGTFLLVLAAAGAAVVQARSGGQIGRVAEVTAPGITVLVVILFMGAVSGAHLNPVVSIAFALRGDFGWRRVPGYIAAQLVGAALAAVLLRVTFGNVAQLGATLPGNGFGSGQAFTVEIVLSFGLVSAILGTASSAQNIGPLSAVGVGGYIALAGLWASPVSGASMNPARSVGPALISGDLHHLWVYLAGPTLGAIAAVGAPTSCADQAATPAAPAPPKEPSPNTTHPTTATISEKRIVRCSSWQIAPTALCQRATATWQNPAATHKSRCSHSTSRQFPSTHVRIVGHPIGRARWCNLTSAE